MDSRNEGSSINLPSKNSVSYKKGDQGDKRKPGSRQNMLSSLAKNEKERTVIATREEERFQQSSSAGCGAIG